MKIIFLTFVFVSISFSQVFNVYDSSSFRDALKESANNKQNDTIILNKGIYSTSSFGVFNFVDNEKYDLVIKSAEGLKKDDVILDGNSKNQILNFINTKDSILKIENLTLKDGDTSSKAGTIFTNQRLILQNCSIKLANNFTKTVSIYSPKRISLVNTSIDY